ncbi:MAG TPA: MnhB domain-containing protein [Solirubrobacteraceae bacterium]
MSAASARALRRRVDPPHRPWAAALLVAALAVGLAAAFVGLPREHAALPAIARRALVVALPRWHITEPVNEVVYGTRGFDTFGETFLLLAAVVSVVLLTRRREVRAGEGGEEAAGAREEREIDPQHSAADRWERLARLAEHEEDDDGGGRPSTPDIEPLGQPAPEHAQAMSVVVRTAVRTAAPVLAIAGIYLAAWGYSPGGGFPAGAVILGVVLLLYAGFGRARIAHLVRQTRVEALELLGAAAIVAIAVLGLILKGAVSANFLPLARNPETILSGGVLQAFSAGELIEVSTGLIIVVFALLEMRHDWASDEAEQ